MKNNQLQSGSAVLAIVAALAIVLLGAGGFIYWKTVLNKPSVAINDTVPGHQDRPKTENITSSLKGYLTIDNWGVKFKLPTDVTAEQINYRMVTGARDGLYGFSTKRVEALGGDCASSEATAVNKIGLAAVYRLTAPTEKPTGDAVLVNHLDGYYYYVFTAPANCAQDNTNIQSEDQAMLSKLLNGIEKK